MIKMAKVKNKEQNLNATREKTRITYKRTPAKLSVDVSTEILLVIRDWHDIFKLLKGENLQLMILYPENLFRIEGEEKHFSDKSWKSSSILNWPYRKY